MPQMNITKKASGSRRSAIPRPLNSFMIFRMEHQASVSKEIPGATHQDISKKLSTKWKALTVEEKQEYKAKALAAKEKHKLLYPDYKFRPRRKPAAPKKTKKSNNSKPSAVPTFSSNAYYHQPQIQYTDFSSEQMCALPDTTLVHPLQAVDVTIAVTNDLDDDGSTAATYYDSQLLCPTLHEPSYHDPSASPSTFSMMSQFSGLSPSMSSDYGSIAAHNYPEYFDGYPYYCDTEPVTYMPPSYECIPFIDYSQIDPVAIPFGIFDAPIADLMPPQIIYPESQHQYPPAILDHTQPMFHADSLDTVVHNVDLSSFNTSYALISEAPLLTQPFVFVDYETMPY